MKNYGAYTKRASYNAISKEIGVTQDKKNNELQRLAENGRKISVSSNRR